MVFHHKSLIPPRGVLFTFPFVGETPRLEKGFRRVERPAGQAPVDDNDEYGGDVVDGVGVGGVDDNEAPVAISNNDVYDEDGINDGGMV